MWNVQVLVWCLKVGEYIPAIHNFPNNKIPFSSSGKAEYAHAIKIGMNVILNNAGRDLDWLSRALASSRICSSCSRVVVSMFETMRVGFDGSWVVVGLWGKHVRRHLGVNKLNRDKVNVVSPTTRIFRLRHLKGWREMSHSFSFGHWFLSFFSLFFYCFARNYF